MCDFRGTENHIASKGDRRRRERRDRGRPRRRNAPAPLTRIEAETGRACPDLQVKRMGKPGARTDLASPAPERWSEKSMFVRCRCCVLLLIIFFSRVALEPLSVIWDRLIRKAQALDRSLPIERGHR